MKEIWLRIKAETPIFWKKVRSISISIGVSGIALITANTTIPLDMPQDIMSVCKYIVAGCIAIAGTASLTKTDS